MRHALNYHKTIDPFTAALKVNIYFNADITCIYKYNKAKKLIEQISFLYNAFNLTAWSQKLGPLLYILYASDIMLNLKFSKVKIMRMI